MVIYVNLERPFYPCIFVKYFLSSSSSVHLWSRFIGSSATVHRSKKKKQSAGSTVYHSDYEIKNLDLITGKLCGQNLWCKEPNTGNPANSPDIFSDFVPVTTASQLTHHTKYGAGKMRSPNFSSTPQN